MDIKEVIDAFAYAKEQQKEREKKAKSLDKIVRDLEEGVQMWTKYKINKIRVSKYIVDPEIPQDEMISKVFDIDPSFIITETKPDLEAMKEDERFHHLLVEQRTYQLRTFILK